MTCTKFYKHLESLVEKCIKKFTPKNRYKFYDQLNKLISRALLESLPLQSKINILSVSLCSYINIRCAFPGEHGLQSIVPIKLFYLRCFDLFITNPTDVDTMPYLVASKNLFASVVQSCLSKVRRAGLGLDVSYLVSLERISRDPWGHPTLGALLRDEEVDHGEVLEFLTVTEQPESLRSRIKFFMEHNCLDLAFNLLRWAVRHQVVSKDVSAITLLLHLTCRFGFDDSLGLPPEETDVVGSVSTSHGFGSDAFHVDPTSGCLFDRFGQMLASSDFSIHLDSIVGEIVNEPTTSLPSLHKRSIDDVDSFVESETKRRRVRYDSESSGRARNDSLPPRNACMKSHDQNTHGNKMYSNESEGMIGISASQSEGLQNLEMFGSATQSGRGSKDLSYCDREERSDLNKCKAKCYFQDLFYELCSKVPLQIVVQIFHMTGYGFLEFQEMFQKYHPIILRTLLLIIWRKGEISDISRLEMLIGKWLEVEKNWGKHEKLFTVTSPEHITSLSSCAKHKTMPTPLAMSEPHVNEIFGNHFQKETDKMGGSTAICQGDGSGCSVTDNSDGAKERSGSSWLVAMLRELVDDDGNAWQTIMLVKKILSECGGQHLRLCSLILLDLLKKERFRHYIGNTLPGRSKVEEDEASENLSTICKVLVDVSRLAGRKDIALSCILSSAFLQPSNMSFDSIKNLFIKSELAEIKSQDKLDQDGAKGHLPFLKIETSDDSSFLMQKDGHLENTKFTEMEEILEDVKISVERLRDSRWRSEGSWDNLELLMAQHYKQSGWVWDFKRNCFRKIRYRKVKDELLLSQKFPDVKRRRGRPRLHPSTCDESDCSVATVTADECSNDRSDNHNSQDSRGKTFRTTRRRKYRKLCNKFELGRDECIQPDRAHLAIGKLEQEGLKAEKIKYARKKQRTGALYSPDKQKSSQSSNFLAVRKQKLKEKLLLMRQEKERAEAVKSKSNPNDVLADDLRPCVTATISNSASYSSVPELTRIEEFGDRDRTRTSSSGEPPSIVDERIDGVRFDEIEHTDDNNKEEPSMFKDFLVTEFKNIERIEENFKVDQLEMDEKMWCSDIEFNLEMSCGKEKLLEDDIEIGDNGCITVEDMCEDKIRNNDTPVSVRDGIVGLRDEIPVLQCNVLFEIPEQAEEIPITASVGPNDKVDTVTRMSETLAGNVHFDVHSDDLPDASWQTTDEKSASVTNCIANNCHLELKETNIPALEKVSTLTDVLMHNALDSRIIPDERESNQKDYLTLIREVIDAELSLCDIEPTVERSMDVVVMPVDESSILASANQSIKSNVSPQKSPNISEDSRSLVSTVGDSSDCLAEDSSACILHTHHYEEIVGPFSSKTIKEKERTKPSRPIVREDVKLNGVAKVALPRLDLARVMKRRRLRVMVERFDGRQQVPNIESRSNNYHHHFSMTLKPSISFVQLSSSCDPSVTSMSSSASTFVPPSNYVPPLHSEPSLHQSMISLVSSSSSSVVEVPQQSLPLVSSLSALSLNSVNPSESSTFLPSSPSYSSTFTLSTSLSPLSSLLATSGPITSLSQRLVPSRSLLFSVPNSNAIFLSAADSMKPLSLSLATAATSISLPSLAQLSPAASPITFLSKPSFIPVLGALSFPLPSSLTLSHSTLTEMKSLKVTWLSQRPKMSISPSISDKSPKASFPLNLPTPPMFSPINSEEVIEAPKLSTNVESDPLSCSALCSSASLLTSLPFSSLAFVSSSQSDKNLGVIKISSFLPDKAEKLDAIFDFKNATAVSIPSTGSGSCRSFGNLFLSAGESIGLPSNLSDNDIFLTKQDVVLNNTDYGVSPTSTNPVASMTSTTTLVDVIHSSASIETTSTIRKCEVGIVKCSSYECLHDKVISISTTSTEDTPQNNQETESSLKIVSKQCDEGTDFGDLSKKLCETICVSTFLSNAVETHNASANSITTSVQAEDKEVESVDLLLPLASKTIEIPLLFEHPPSPCSLNSWMGSSMSSTVGYSVSSSISKCRANTIRSRFRSLNVASDLSCLSCQRPIKDFSQLDRHLVVEHPGL